MSLLIDFFPALLFFAVLIVYDIFVATAVFIVASVIQIAYLYKRQKLTKMHWLTLVLVLVFGGLTLLLRDEAFIKWKPSAVYVAFALVFVAAKLIWRRDLLRYIMKGIEFPDRVWSGLTWAWAGFFMVLAVLNWLIAFHLGLSTEAWAAFKTFGAMGLILLFTLGQILVLARYLPQEEPQEKP